MRKAIFNHSNHYNNAASSYISTSHQESHEKLQTRPGWTRRTRCVHPAERQRGRGGEPLVLAVLLMHSVENGARRRAPSCWLFLPCTWFSPEAETCHLWSLVRRMLCGCIVQANTKQTSPNYDEAKVFPSYSLFHLMNGDRWKSPTLTSELGAFFYLFRRSILLEYIWKFPIPFQPVTSNGLSGGKFLPLWIVMDFIWPQMHLTLRNTSHTGKLTLKVKRAQKSIWINYKYKFTASFKNNLP